MNRNEMLNILEDLRDLMASPRHETMNCYVADIQSVIDHLRGRADYNISTYLQNYISTFKDIVEYEDGTLNKDQVMRELSDYAVFMETAMTVYCRITGGRISKINTTADAIIGVYQDEITETVNAEIEDRRTYCCPICFEPE